MEESKNIYEPLKLFDSQFRVAHQKNVSDYFEALIKKSKVKEEENVQTVKEIRKKEADIAFADKECKKHRGRRGFFIFLIVVLFLAAIFFVYNFIQMVLSIPPYANILIALVAVGIAVYLIVEITTKLNKEIKGLDKNVADLRTVLKGLTDTAWAQMYPLNSLYDWGMTAEIIHQTIPLIEMDKYFDIKRYDYLRRKYGLWDNSDPDSSVLFVQSGEIVGNPFLLTRSLKFAMGRKEYRGSLYITWTVTVTVNGRSETQFRSQTLYATVSKPFPTYGTHDMLIYGNEAAPDLSFSRDPSKANRLNEKQVEKLADRESKKVEKMARKSISSGGSLTVMTNEDFEGLFKAIDRNNEVQFRLLFTPLAQKQIVDLIKDKKVGYGDDFSFIKSRCLNMIIPEHLSGQDIAANPNKYVKYDLAEARKIFNDYNNDYFKMFYFALAPILSIPLYQQYKPAEFIYKNTYESNVSCWEHEAVSNWFDINQLKHPSSVTSNILKTQVLATGNGADEINVNAKGFQGVPRIDYVAVYGGDNRWHNVSVPWTEYLPVSKDSRVIVKVADQTARPDIIKNNNNNQDWRAFFEKTSGGINNVVFCKSLLALNILTKFDAGDNQTLSKLLAADDKNPK